ncbi:hypothetical protein [Embleya scabrispora]|uniref:hypothetical protein n=1 Tax=Embleya scabrispora TaxID=159449 RepID=UPI00039EE0B3|nr:hypothetical protein [Embleya scabrispora]MYS84191.1 hypothetical protein [Streptomyces sp. SID5474]
MNDHDLFQLILDQPEPDFPSVVDAAVAGGRRARRRRRVATLGAGAAVLAIAGAGLFLAPSNPERVGPAAPVPPATTAVTSRPTPDSVAPSLATTPSVEARPAKEEDDTRADAPTLPERTPTTAGPVDPPLVPTQDSAEDSRMVRCQATRTGKCPSSTRN